MAEAGLGGIYLFPYVTKAEPSPLVSIVVSIAVTIILGLDICTVGDMGKLRSADSRSQDANSPGNDGSEVMLAMSLQKFSSLRKVIICIG